MNATEALAVAMGDPADDGGRCELLGPFALFVQGALGALALLSLVWKRARESPQRPILIWWFDVSKQVLGSVLVHIANLVLSMLSSGTFSTEPTPKTLGPPPVIYSLLRRHGPGGPPGSFGDPDGPEDGGGRHHSNPCSFYLLNLAIDTTLGIVILIYLLRVFNRLLLLSPIRFFRIGITSGNYGDPPKWSYWAKQAIVYFAGLMSMKFVVWIIFALFPWLGRVGDWLLAWTEGDRRLQVFFVMFFFPLVMNAMQYYIIDSFIKNQDPSSTVIQDSAPTRAGNRRSFNDSEDVFSSDSGDDPSTPTSLSRRRTSGKKTPSLIIEEYNPDTDGSTILADGESSPSSSYQANMRNGRLSPGGKKGVAGSSKSRNSSMMLLPGSRGPSTPGYEEEDSNKGFGGRRGSEEDDNTLVGV